MQDPDDIAKDVSDSGQDLADQAVSAAGDLAEGNQVAMSEAQEAVNTAVEQATAGIDAPGAAAAGAAMATAAAAPLAPTATAAVTSAPGQRPTGITVLGILAVLNGAWNLLIALPAMGFTMLFDSFTAGLASGVINVAQGVLWLAVGIGAFKLQPWVWILGLLGAALAIVSVIWGIIAGEGAWFCGLFGLIVPGIILFYLTRPHVKAAFGR
jgi:hypothetical protein